MSASFPCQPIRINFHIFPDLNAKGKIAALFRGDSLRKKLKKTHTHKIEFREQRELNIRDCKSSFSLLSTLK